MIDSEGFRANVGIILTNRHKQVFWGRRIGQDAWQFPQGGMSEEETPEETLYRELYEEVGLEPGDVSILARSSDWVRYRLPTHLIRQHNNPLCIGQKQIWFLLKLETCSEKIRLNLSESPEFDSWCWVKFWHPLKDVIAFKRPVYQQVLKEFSDILFPKKQPQESK